MAACLAAFVQSDLRVENGPRTRAIKATLVGRPYANFNDPAPTVRAAQRLRDDSRAPLYSDFRVDGSSFVYPPLAAVLYEPVAAADDPYAVLLRANQLAFWLIVAIAVLLARPAGAWAMAAMALGAVAFHPLTRAVELNQASVIITLAVGACLLAAARNRDVAAGIALAVAISIKPHLVLMLPVMAWHARRIAVVAVAACAGLFIASIAAAGIANQLDYARVVIPALSEGYAFYPNQSWNGLLHRLVQPDMTSFVLAPSSPVVRILSVLLGLATVALGTWLSYRAPRDGDRRVVVVAFSWLVATLASPIAWEHHYAPALLLFALWLRARAIDDELSRLDVVVAFAWIAIASYFEVRGLGSPVTRLLASYTLAGGLALAIAVQRAMYSSKSWMRVANT